MSNSKENILPDHESEIELAERFNEYFMVMVFVIHKNLEGLRTTSNSYTEEIRKYQVALTHFRETSEDDVARLIQKSPKKSCSLDPIPTWLLNKCKATFTPTITRIVNSSIKFSLCTRAPQISGHNSVYQKEEFGSCTEELSSSFELKIHI